MKSLSSRHKPVLLREVIDFLDVKEGGRYIDCTFGFGGHAGEIIKRGGRVLGFESDKESLAVAKQELGTGFKELGKELLLVEGNFANLGAIAKERGFDEVDGILYDLGLSSWQLEKSGRGFSFQRDEPLDMRSDAALGVTAADIVNTLSEHELTKLFTEFGEEPRAFGFARSLVCARAVRPIQTTYDLIKTIGASDKEGRRRIHPATKVFQALRIAVNSELLSLTASLPQAQKLLKVGGRLVVISFHSLEDRIVKDFGKTVEDLVQLTEKPVTPSGVEIKANPKARSAKLRAYEKIGYEI